ncbi:MAG: amino acid ABC transporter ATP-binding protein [Verrucomicrobiales bacterium]
MKSYEGAQALRGLDLVIPAAAKVVAFIGPSGGGKSTLLRLLGGLEIPERGSIAIDGRELPSERAGLLAHRRAHGYLFQAFNLFPHLCLLDNVTLPLERVHGWGAADARARARECLERLGLADFAARMPAELSGGQQQRGAIARAIAAHPKFLVLDEPTSALDPEMTAEVLAVVEELCAAGQEILMSTHEMGFAKAVAEITVFLAEGQVVEGGAHLFSEAKSERVTRFLSKVMRY